MKIALASQSQLKLRALQTALKGSFGQDENPEIVRFSVNHLPDQIPQPLYDGGHRMAQKRYQTVMDELRSREIIDEYDLLVVIENYMDFKHLSWEDIALIRIYDLNNDLTYTHLELCGTVPNGAPEGNEENEIELMDVVMAKDNLIRAEDYNPQIRKSRKATAPVIGSQITFGQLYHDKYPHVPPDDWTGAVECRSREESLRDGLLYCLIDIFEHWKLLDEASAQFRLFPNFPKPGVNFLSWDNLFLKPKLMSDFYQYLAQKYVGPDKWQTPGNQDKLAVDLVIGLESRGFLLSGPLAQTLGVGQTFLRKEGKIPGPIVRQTYMKEYGPDVFELRNDLKPKRVIIIDDVLATGGSLVAAANLVRKAGHTVVDCIVIKDVAELREQASQALAGIPYRVIL